MIRALLVDDEALARANLRALLGELGGWEIVGEAANGREACSTIETCTPDVVFLDIRMPGLSGLEVARSLGRPPSGCGSSEGPLVVFATAFEEHALEAFEVEAADYLIKPIERRRFFEAAGRLERRIAERRRQPPAALPKEASSGSDPLDDPVAESTTTSSASASSTDEATKVLAVKSVGRVQLIDVEEIQWIGSAGNYVRLYLASRCLLHRATLASLERELGPAKFLRIHRSTMVNRQQVAELQTSVHGRYQLKLRDGTELEISQRFKTRVYAELMPE